MGEPLNMHRMITMHARSGQTDRQTDRPTNIMTMNASRYQSAVI